MGMPTLADIRRLTRNWDYAQANDQSVLDNDPQKDRVTEAVELLDADPHAAFRILLDLAEQGSVWSMLKVGECYRRGRGVPADASLAEDWIRRAYEGGSQRALLIYGDLLASRGDLDGSESVFSAGTDCDWAPAFYWLARRRLDRGNTRGTLLQVRPLLERAAELGSPQAKWVLARNMLWGRFGLREIPRGHNLMREFSRGMLAETRVVSPRDVSSTGRQPR